MTALAQNTIRRSMGTRGVLLAVLFAMPLAASAHLYTGSLAALNPSGNLVPASADASLRVVGIMDDEADNSAGIAGAVTAVPRRGAFYLANSGTTDAVTDGDLGRNCYVVDDNTVARTSGLGARPVAGKVIGVDSYGVLVEVGVDDAAGDEELMFLAGADLSARQFHFVNLDGAAALQLAGAGGRAIGVLQNAPANGAVGVVRPLQSGRASRLVAGAALAVGDDVELDANGRAVPAVTGRVNTSDAGAANDPVIGGRVLGIALLAAGADGAATRALLVSSGIAPQTAS